MSVQQVIATAAPNDAVTSQALALDALLREWGHRSEVFAEHVHPDLVGRVRSLATRPPDADVAVLRYSIWSAAVDDVLRRPPRRLGLVYHNVTPPEFLWAANAQVAELCRVARARLPELASRVDLALADSAFNALDLERAGIGPARVVPLLLPLPTPRPADGRSAREPLVLTVGRVVPNKRLELIVRAVALLRATGVPDARLAAVGSWEGFEPYRDALARLTSRLGTGGVELVGAVPDARRDELLDRAAVYVCASAHEGFCAPLVEAMARGLPVVAIAGSAVTETVANGGLLLPEADPAVLCEAIRMVAADRVTSASLSARALARARDFAPDAVRARLREALDPLIGAIR